MFKTQSYYFTQYKHTSSSQNIIYYIFILKYNN